MENHTSPSAGFISNTPTANNSIGLYRPRRSLSRLRKAVSQIPICIRPTAVASRILTRSLVPSISVRGNTISLRPTVPSTFTLARRWPPARKRTGSKPFPAKLVPDLPLLRPAGTTLRQNLEDTRHRAGEVNYQRNRKSPWELSIVRAGLKARALSVSRLFPRPNELLQTLFITKEMEDAVRFRHWAFGLIGRRRIPLRVLGGRDLARGGRLCNART